MMNKEYNMKKLIALAVVSMSLLSGCTLFGFSSKENEATVQPKKIVNHTPIVCPEFKALDASMGIMVNGVGSMSKEDLEVVLTSKEQKDTIEAAISSGKLLKIKYSTGRVVICQDHIANVLDEVHSFVIPTTNDTLKK